MNTLRDESVRQRVVELDAAGHSQVYISEATGIPRTTLGDFLRKESHVAWWAMTDMGAKLISERSRVKPPVETHVCGDKPITEFKYPIETTRSAPDGCTHMFIGDTQCKDGIDMSYLRWIGEYIVDRKPDVIVHIGDHADMPSLSSYDKGKKSAEGRRVTLDINAAIVGMEFLLKPLWEYQQKELLTYGAIHYKPRMDFTGGNHGHRIVRHVEANPELEGFLSIDNLLYEQMGWTFHDFLKPVVINGVMYVHYLANPMTGKPYTGTALGILKTVGESFSMGHKQTLDVATRFLPASGRQQWGLINGACYTHDEDYKGYQGNHHWRGLVVKHNVSNGSYNPMFVDLDYLKEKFD